MARLAQHQRSISVLLEVGGQEWSSKLWESKHAKAYVLFQIY